MELRILELFSGIGGMHFALKHAAEVPGEVVAAMDINTVANAVYAHNHSPTPLLNNNIQRLSPKTLMNLDVNAILMSPPCQPHTRVGHQRDVADNRSDALQHLCHILPECTGLCYVLLENVKGFEGSEAHRNFIAALQKAGYHWREFILSPTQFGCPNTRTRYYCVARKGDDFPFAGGRIWDEMPPDRRNESRAPAQIDSFLEAESAIPDETYLPEKVLNKRVWLMDIVTSAASNTMCFTKAYTHYSEGTGSIYTPLSAAESKDIFAQVKNLEQKEPSEELEKERLDLLKRLRLRYFTPREVARLMSFPEHFSFPTETTKRQKYRLLGNSINILVVGELIRLLCSRINE